MSTYNPSTGEKICDVQEADKVSSPLTNAKLVVKLSSQLNGFVNSQNWTITDFVKMQANVIGNHFMLVN